MGSDFVEPLDFIKSCVQRRKIFWTYHVNMRMAERFIPRDIILASVDSYEILESYPDDKYLFSCLVYACYNESAIHILFALDMETDTVRIITAYRPSSDKWENGGKTRRTP
jgi:hypothetical protein